MNKIKHRFLSLDDVASIVSWFVFDDKGILPMSESTHRMYPELINQISPEDHNLHNTIKTLISEKNELFLKDNADILKKYDELILNYSEPFFELLNQYFGIDKTYNINAQIGLIPVFPRDIINESYCISKVEDVEVIDTFMHETCHYAFFEKCKKIFVNFDKSDIDKPALLWYLSEIVVDPILNSEKFQLLFKHKFKAYENFYTIKIDGELVMDRITEIFNAYDVETAIVESYNYLLKNEMEFRKLSGDENEVQNKILLVNSGCSLKK